MFVCVCVCVCVCVFVYIYIYIYIYIHTNTHIYIHSFLISAFYPWERDPVPILQESWMGPRTGLDGCGSLPPRFDPRAVHPVSCRHTD